MYTSSMVGHSGSDSVQCNQRPQHAWPLNIFSANVVTARKASTSMCGGLQASDLVGAALLGHVPGLHSSGGATASSVQAAC